MNSMMVPVGVIRPMRLPVSSVNQRFLSGPTVMPLGLLPVMGRLYSMNPACGVTRPMRSWSGSVNHRLPSGPPTMPPESPPFGTPYSLMPPAG